MSSTKQTSNTRILMYGFGALMSIFLLFGAFNSYKIQTILNLNHMIYNHPLVVSNAALQANVIIAKMHRSMKNMVVSHPSSRIQQFIETVNEDEEQVYQHLNIVKNNILSDKGKTLESEARNLFAEWRPIRNKVITLVNKDQREKAAGITIGKGAEHVAMLEQKMLGLTNHAINKASEFTSKSERLLSRLNVISIFLLLLGFLTSILVAFLTLKQTALTEKKLKENEKMHRTLVHNIPGMTYKTYPDWSAKILSGNQKICGYTIEELNLLPENWLSIIHPDDRQMVLCEGSVLTKIPGNQIQTYRIITKNKDIRWVEDHKSFFFSEEGRFEEINGILFDITQRKKADLALQESTEMLKQVQRVAKIGSWQYDPITRKYAWTEEVFRIFGLEPQSKTLPYEELKKMIHPKDRSHFETAVKRAVTKGVGYNLEWRLIRPDGEVRNINSRCIAKKNEAGIVIQLIGTTQDITDHKQTEKEKSQLLKQYRWSQKMEPVGRLAGGMAHDYNKALTVMMGYTELAMADADPKGKLYADLNQVLKAGRHATGITRQLLAFTRKQTIAPIVIDLNKTVENMIEMLRRFIGEDIDIEWLPGKNLWPVKIDPAQMDQVMANLCVNAMDAIEGVGKITIETDKAGFDETFCFEHKGLVTGELVLLRVSDNGCGIEKEIQDKIFEPFFTTKDTDKGTGLGLAAVYEIIKQNNGFVNVYSQPGHGTTIKIYLPRYEGRSVDRHQEVIPEIPQGRGETILVVEDDLSTLKLAQKILNAIGYTVLTADTPKKAMELAKDHADKIHLMVTDVTMPEMNGFELANNLQSLNPELKAIFMSGYIANTIVQQDVLDKGINFIQKPFSQNDLAQIVRKVLDG